MSIITKDLNRIINALENEKLAAIPTETVYGLAGNANVDAAIKRVYTLKSRPLNHPLIMHIAKEADLTNYAQDIPDYVNQLIWHFWPGPLTLVLPCRMDQVNPLVTAGQNTVAIRSPAHPVTQELLSKLDFPLVAPSANQFGKVSPTTAEHVQDSFKDDDLLILDGGRCSVGIESTILLVTDPRGYRILRHGLINETMLRSLLPNHELSESTYTQPIRVSGGLKTHYQPEKPLYYFTDSNLAHAYCVQNPAVFVLSFQNDQTFHDYPGCHVPINPDAFAYELYYQLRHADESTAQVILIALPPDSPAWRGSRERIMKAGAPLSF